MKKIMSVSIALLALAGCAKRPESIVAVPNQGACTQEDRTRLGQLEQKQRQAANSDAIGVFLIGVPVASLSGADNEAEIAILKGRCTIR